MISPQPPDTPPVPEGTITGVYRRRNADHVVRLLEPALARGWRTAWWALDGVSPPLADVTIGEGPGEKFPLLNRALDTLPEPRTWSVIADDDLRFLRGDLIRLVAFCDHASLDLAQPARARGTSWNHDITISARLSRARLTSFVEGGPLVVVRDGWRHRVLPLPERRGMGWGVELDWFDLVEQGCRLGIVDAVTIEHFENPASEYDTEPLYRALGDELAERGLRSWGPLKYTIATWRVWQRRPPWARRNGS